MLGFRILGRDEKKREKKFFVIGNHACFLGTIKTNNNNK